MKKGDRNWWHYGVKLTRLFNRWIRYRDTQPILGGHARVGICITCRKPCSFEKLQACHFIPAQYLGTRWHEKNVNAGCAHCNKWLEGNRIEYAKWLPKKWGKDVLDELAVAKKLNAKHPDVETLKLKIKDYTERLKGFEV
ncbi:MAG: recombination protein NinG [Fibrobacteria bacterium]